MPHRRLQRVIDATIEDFSSMPFFVRPMVKAGLRKRTGKSIDEWKDIARQLAGAPDANARASVVARHPGLVAALERLAENYRTAPDRAGRAMKGPALERVTAQSREREQLVRELIDDLR